MAIQDLKPDNANSNGSGKMPVFKFGLRNFFIAQRQRFKKNNNNHNSAKAQTDLDKKLVYSLAKSRIPNFTQLKYVSRFLNRHERWALRLSTVVLIASAIFAATRFVITNMEIAPDEGGEYIEGLIGAPQYINPLYSNINEIDNDISWLVYSSLFKRGKNSELANDLVEKYEMSPDNKTYTITIKQNVKWHDGAPLTADDVVFTFNAIKDQQYKSPLRNSFNGVEIEKNDDHKFTFKLTDPYAAFLELLTFGIMPANLWTQIPPESAALAGLNLKPVGSGPYKYEKLIKDDKTGSIKEYVLAVNKEYYQTVPFVNIKFKFYPNYEEAITAINNNEIDAVSYLPREFKEQIKTQNVFNFFQLNMPQLTMIFYNDKANPALADKKVKQALAYAINRGFIITKVLADEARIIEGPILPDSFAYFKDIKKYDYNPSESARLLDEAGWKLTKLGNAEIGKAQTDINSADADIKARAEMILSLGEGEWRKKGENFLTIKLTTIDRNENSKILDEIKIYWEKQGIKTITEVVPGNRISADIIMPRNFEALFYGEVVGADPDPYVFWHSSQAEKGYNISNFQNKEADQLLEDARLITDQAARQEKYKRFQEIIAEEMPSIFMYSPYYTFAQNKRIKGFDVKNVLVPHDRFANVQDWYINTSKKINW